MRPATIVGSANGRSISALTKRLAAEVVAHQHPGDQRAHHRVDRRDDHRGDQRQLERGDGLRRRDIASQNASRPSSSERTTTAASGIRTISVSQATERPPATSGPADTARRARAARGRARRGAVSAQPAVETPRSCSISATEPFSGSKNSSLTFDQPPNSSILKSFFGVRDTCSCRRGPGSTER